MAEGVAEGVGDPNSPLQTRNTGTLGLRSKRDQMHMDPLEAAEEAEVVEVRRRHSSDWDLLQPPNLPEWDN